MSDSHAVDLAMLLFRCGIGTILAAHGYNHIWRGGKIDGTAGWFKSMGMRPPQFQAWLASITELAGGGLLIVGLLTPFGGAAVVGTMFVAWAINHRGNGFFIFHPGEGWEYVMTLGLCGALLGATGAGSWSLDNALGIDDDISGWTGFGIAAGAGLTGGLLLLATCWRPPTTEDAPGR